MKKFVYILFLVSLSLACNKEPGEIGDLEKKVQQAINTLRDELTSPANGWKILYQPTNESGSFLMLLTFNDKGEVNIKSDVSADNGTYLDQTITYRIDNSLRIELIFETYGVFHYLFDLEQTTFGAEFEFYYNEKEGNKLVFSSKTDTGNPTILVFEPASPDDVNLLSTEISTNLDGFKGLTPQIFGAEPPIQQVYLNNSNVSFFWTIDLDKRIVEADLAGVGTTFEEIYGNESGVNLNFSSGYSFQGGKLMLNSPLVMTVDGKEITISELTLNNFDGSGGGSLCPASSDVTPTYSGSAGASGSFIMSKTLFDRGGDTFTANNDGLYSVNIPFIFDDSLQSLSDEGIIYDNIPTAVGFLMTYGFEHETIPAYSVGFITEVGDSVDIILREFEPTTSIGNQVNIVLKNSFYQSDNMMSAQDSTNMMAVTDEIFSGGRVYAYDFPIQGLTVFRLFNPCNRFEIFLVQ